MRKSSIGIEQIVDHLNHERDQVHIMLRTSTMGVPRKWILIRKPFYHKFEIVLHHLNSVWVTLSGRFSLHLEISFNHLSICVCWEISTFNWEKVVALSVLVPNDCSFPLFLGLLELRIGSECILMTSKVNEAWMGDCSIALSGYKAISWLWNLTDLQLLGEYIHPKDIRWLFSVALKTDDTFGTNFLLHGTSSNLFQELVLFLLEIHLLHYLLPLLLRKFFLFITLLCNQVLIVLL